MSKFTDEVAGTVKVRGDYYGHPSENHLRTARLWSAYLGVEVTQRDVCMLNILQKISRDRATPLRDNMLDIAGYAANVDMMAGGS